MAQRLRVLHLISSFGDGGAETMLRRLAVSMDRQRFQNAIVHVTDNDSREAAPLRAAGISVTPLDMPRRISNPLPLFRLGAILRRFRPHVLQTWLYHADLLGALLKVQARGAALVWGLQHGNLDASVNKTQTLLVVRMCAALSRVAPRAIVCCSEAVRRAHRERGYSDRKLMVIHNGYDTERFRPHEGAGYALREELGIPQHCPVISMVARFHPQKNHACLIDAAALLIQATPDAHFVLCGASIDWENTALAEWIRSRGISGHFHLLGPVSNPWHVMAGSTVLVSSSAGEGMSSVIGEGMACGAMCVATDVGNAAEVIGDTGFVVRPNDPLALSRGLLSALALPPEARRAMAIKARTRITDHYSLARTVDQYERLYKALAAQAQDLESIELRNAA